MGHASSKKCEFLPGRDKYLLAIDRPIREPEDDRQWMYLLCRMRAFNSRGGGGGRQFAIESRNGQAPPEDPERNSNPERRGSVRLGAPRRPPARHVPSTLLSARSALLCELQSWGEWKVVVVFLNWKDFSVLMGCILLFKKYIF